MAAKRKSGSSAAEKPANGRYNTRKVTGRPSSFSQETAGEICERLVNGESLREICKSEHMPHAGTVCRWLADERYASFREQYARAREAQADVLADETLDIADDASNDWMRRNGKDDEPGWQFNGEAARRSQIRIDARKWLAGKLAPKKYGDKQHHELSGSIAVTHEAALNELE